MKRYIISALVGLTITGAHAQDAIDVIPPATKTPVELGAKTPAPNATKPKPNRPNAKKAAQANAQKTQAQKARAAGPAVAAAPPLVPPIPSVTPAKSAVPAIPDFGPAPAPMAKAAAKAPAPPAPPIPNVAVTERILKSTTQGRTVRDNKLPLINTSGVGGKPSALRKDMAIATTIEIPLAETTPIGGPPPPKKIETTTALPTTVGTEVTDIELSKISNEQIAKQLLQTTRGLPVSVETDESSAVIRIGVIKSEPVPAPKPFIVDSVPVPGSLGPSTGPDGIPIAKTIPVEKETPIGAAAETTPAPIADTDPVAPPPGIEIDELAAEALVKTVQSAPAIPAPADLEETVATPVAEVEGASEWRRVGVPDKAVPATDDELPLAQTEAELAVKAMTPATPMETVAVPTSASGIPEGLAVKRGWNPFRPKKKVIVPPTSIEVPEAAVEKQSGLFRKRN